MLWNKPSLRICKQWEHEDSSVGAGAIIEIIHGKGTLTCTMEMDDDSMYLSLMLRGIPLAQLEGGEYFCPTCEKILRSAYQLKDKQDFRIPEINASKHEVPLPQAIENLTPLFTLLPSGFYAIYDTQLHPTDGNKHLFWDFPNEDHPIEGTCDYYLGDYTYAESFPHFCVATQPWSAYDEQRVQYYREHPNARAIAYHMDGFLCALLDGHHKAMAAAMDQRDVNALVILPCSFCQYQDKEITLRATSHLEFTSKDLNVSKATLQNAKNAQNTSLRKNKHARIRNQPFFCSSRPFSQSVSSKLAAIYPTVELQAQIDHAGNLSDELLESILTGTCHIDESQATTVLLALAGLHHPLFWDVGTYFCRQSYSNQTMFELLKCMMCHPEKETHLDYLIQKLIEFEDCSYIYDMICNYL